MTILSNPEIPHQSHMPELLSFRKKCMLPQKKGARGVMRGFSRFNLNESEQMEADQHELRAEYVTDRFYLSEAAEYISKLMDSIKNNYPPTWERNSQGRFGHYCDTRTNLKRK